MEENIQNSKIAIILLGIVIALTFFLNFQPHQRRVTRMDKEYKNTLDEVQQVLQRAGSNLMEFKDVNRRHIQALQSKLTQANERNKRFERFLKEKNYINFYAAWEHRILGDNK